MEVGEADYWRAQETEGERTAAFCRLEHVVPWAMREPGWAGVVLVHHRAGHHIRETFESIDDMRRWASAGGPWAT